MLNSFEWNGISFRDFETPAVKLIVKKSPVIPRPAKRYDKYSVRGRNGDIFIPQGSYDNYVQPYDLFLYTTEKGDDLNELAQAISDWLYEPTGYAKLVDDHEGDYFRLAYFTGPFSVENSLTVFGSATVSFNCRPERFLETGDIERVVTNNLLTNGWYTLKNPTNQIAKPLIEIELNEPENTSAVYNGVKIQIEHGVGILSWTYMRQDQATNLIVDSDAMKWKTSVQYAGKNVTGPLEMPLLKPGESKIRVVGLNSNGTEVASNQYPKWTIKTRWWKL